MTPDQILQSFLSGEEVPQTDLVRVQTWLLFNIATETEHLCENLQALLKAQDVEIPEPSNHLGE